MNNFGGMKILRISFGSSQNWTGFRGHFCAFYGFSMWSMYRMGMGVGC